MFRLPISSRALLFATLISALHSLLPPSATFASGPQGDRPQISIKKNYVAISVTVGAELKPLAEVFADCLSEGKAWANLVSRSAAAEWRDNRKAFRDELKWFYDRDYELRSVVGRYVSVVRSDDWFDGGAHPNRYIDAILWDSIARKRVSIRPFFSETSDNGRTMTAVAELAKLSVAAAKLANDINGYDDDGPAAEKLTPEQELERDHFINDGIKPRILEIGAVTLAPSTQDGKSSGLTFHYSPYAVGPYVEGTYTVFVPWSAFRQFLSRQGAALFGGERSKSDEEKW